MDRKIFGDTLRSIRESRDISNSYLAVKLKVSAEFLVQCEGGFGSMSLTILSLWCVHVNVALSGLFESYEMKIKSQ